MSKSVFLPALFYLGFGADQRKAFGFRPRVWLAVQPHRTIDSAMPSKRLPRRPAEYASRIVGSSFPHPGGQLFALAMRMASFIEGAGLSQKPSIHWLLCRGVRLDGEAGFVCAFAGAGFAVVAQTLTLRY